MSSGSKAEAPEWRKDPVCFECEREFTMTVRQHHCRNCGHSFCGKCSSHSISLPHYDITDPVRVCDPCHYQLIEENRDLKKALKPTNLDEIDWQDDKSSDVCMRCGTNFTMLKRRHHCRFCGHIVCADCSRHKLPYDANTTNLVRACDPCVQTRDAEEIQKSIANNLRDKSAHKMEDNVLYKGTSKEERQIEESSEIMSLDFLDQEEQEGYLSLKDMSEVDLYTIGHSHYKFGYAKPRILKKAFHHFRIAASKGHLGALLYTAQCYEHGKGVTHSFPKAMKCYLAGMQRGQMECQFYTAFMYGRGYGTKRDSIQADRLYRGCFHAFRNGAEQGLTSYQFYLARCYLNGNGCEKDEDKAVEWYHTAADGGHVEAQFFLGQMYQRGRGKHGKNLDLAEKYYVMAADRNHAGAQNILQSFFH